MGRGEPERGGEERRGGEGLAASSFSHSLIERRGGGGERDHRRWRAKGVTHTLTHARTQARVARADTILLPAAPKS